MQILVYIWGNANLMIDQLDYRFKISFNFQNEEVWKKISFVSGIGSW